eukprot:INCI1181.1.p1 GENE.INCI1181.1~~INCI1181.1.p1  ORF type:complete len:1094 (+),score=242.69 INCI1181.1:305-3586(+)
MSVDWGSHEDDPWNAEDWVEEGHEDDFDTSTWTIQQKEILLKDLNAYMQGDEWKTVFAMFVNSNCAVFDDPEQQTFSEGQTEIWNKFKDFCRDQINGTVEHYSPQGAAVFTEFLALSNEVLADEDLERQLYITAQTKNLMLLVAYVEEFGKYMAERNQEMEEEALGEEQEQAGAGGDDGDGRGARSRKHGKHRSDKKKHKSRKLRKLKTTKLLRRPSERFLDAIMAQPPNAANAQGSNQHAEKWKCLYCNSVNAHDARSCILCGLAPASESSESLLKRCKKARKVVHDFVSKQKFDNVKTVAKRWVARAAHVEVVAHMLYADNRGKEAVKLVEGHTTICKSYSNLRSAYLTALNSSLTLYMAMCEWEKAQNTAQKAFQFCMDQSFIAAIENPWTPDFGELTDSSSPASGFKSEDSHVLFVETPEPFTASELLEMNLQFLVLLMNICTLYTLYNHTKGGALADDYCARYAEHLNEPRLISFLRRRLTVLIEVYLSRKQHNQAAPLSQQLSSAVMSSPLLTEPLLMSACIQCAKSVVEVLLAQGADVQAVGTNGCTALFCAVRSKSYAEQLTKMLLDAHANPDSVDNDGCTSLHYAASTGNSALVAMLMGYGADTNVTDNYGSLPADYAAQVRDTESQLLLLNVENARGRLNSAASSDQIGDGSEEAKSSASHGHHGSEWVECIDEETGYPFFVNTVTGESEWASKDVWEEHEREIQEKLAANGGGNSTNHGDWADSEGGTELDEGDRQAWNEVSQVRNNLNNLNNVTSDLHTKELQHRASAVDMEAKYDEVLEGTKSAMDEVKAQMAAQQASMLEQQRALQASMLEQQKSQQELDMQAREAAAVKEKEEQIQAMKATEEEMKKRLQQLEEKFQTAQRQKEAAKEAAAKEGLKLEMKQHVAMKEKEKIISNFKDNLKALDEGLAKERSRHRLNLLKKLQLRRQKNARRKTGTTSPRSDDVTATAGATGSAVGTAAGGSLPGNLKALRPKAPPPGFKPPPGPPPHPGGGARAKPRIVAEDNDASPPTVRHSKSLELERSSASAIGGTKPGHRKNGSVGDGSLQPIAGSPGSPSAKRRGRRKKPPPPPPGKSSLPKL